MIYYIEVHSDDLLKTLRYPLCGFEDYDEAMRYIFDKCTLKGGVWPKDASTIKFVPNPGEAGADKGMVWSVKCLEMK